MRLLVRRSQREGGTLSKNVIFCLDARAAFTAAEQQSVTRYKLQNQVIYNSEASKRHLDRGDVARDGSMVGGLKSLASTALAAMNLNITIATLGRGQHIECKSLDELLAAEDAIMQACRNLKAYLDAASTFDGREVLFDFETGEPKAVAQSIASEPLLTAPPAVERVAAAPLQDEPMVSQGRPRPTKSQYDTVDGWAAAIKSDPQLRMGVYAVALLVVVAILWLFVIR